MNPALPAHHRMGISALLGLILAGLGSTPSGAITFGEPDAGRHPNVGALVLFRPPDLGPVPLCSGTLIHERVFLTAGHCTDFVESVLADGSFALDDFFVTFNDDPLDIADYQPLEGVVTHPGYRSMAGLGSIPSRDVGLLVLRNPIGHLTPATLVPAGFLEHLKREKFLNGGVSFTVVGYGSMLTFPPPEPDFSAHPRQWTQSGYLGFNSSWLTLLQNPASGHSGTGFGDSGGPTFWLMPDGSEVLVSITSRGDPKLVATGVTYRIDTTDSLTFIQSVVSSLP